MRSIFVAARSKRRPAVENITGAVLAGGKSLRFGSNKAIFEINGKAMARVISDKMREAGILDVLLVGGSPEVADTLGLSFVADEYPNEGPLGGLITALHNVSTDFLCVLPCDVPRINSIRIRQLGFIVTSNSLHDVGVLATTREHWLCSSWRVRTCLPELERKFADGERAVHRAVNSLSIARVSATDEEMSNINSLHRAGKLGDITLSGD
ncbi:MAG: molybdenum cofactor guanylyltransferase [Ilumatobacteraceae bacterium]